MPSPGADHLTANSDYKGQMGGEPRGTTGALYGVGHD
jgi:hypothetical protein